MHHNLSKGSQTNPPGYHQINQTQHFFRENDKAQPYQAGKKRREKPQENVTIKKSNQDTLDEMKILLDREHLTIFANRFPNHQKIIRLSTRLREKILYYEDYHTDIC